MDSERWKQVEGVLQSALDRAPEERDAFLRVACAGDETLEREVRSLLTSDQRAGDFLRNPAIEVAARDLARPGSEETPDTSGSIEGKFRDESEETILPRFPNGTRFGSYEVSGPIGAGGMGEVYRARDSKLHRDVALKVLSQACANDPELISRFQREAQLLASLNHPHIAAIYGLEESNDALALVMELVEGPTLAERMAEGRLSIEEALCLAKQMAEALAGAHDRGIIHRDLKPANIKITPQGSVKILDFGLGKDLKTDGNAADPGSNALPTRSGIIVGTAPYMSPEQSRGTAVDKRTDIWAFGVVLYEMLTHQRLFAGETTSDILAAVLTKEPDWDRVPLKAQRLLRQCLEKDPKRRLRDIADAWALVDEPPQSLSPKGTERWAEAQPSGVRGATRGLRPKLSTGLPWMIAAPAMVVAAIFGGLLWHATRPGPEGAPRPMMRFSVDLGPQAIRGFPQSGGESLNPVISPDGTRILFPTKAADGIERLEMRRLDQSRVTTLAGTEGAVDPFFSPDGQWIGFFAGQKLKKIPLQGGDVISLCETTGLEIGASWGEGGVIIANLDRFHLSRVPAAGGEPQIVGKPEQHGEFGWRWPQVLPGGENVLFTGVVANSGAAWDSANIEVLSLKSGRVKVVRRGGFFGRYLPSGHLIYIRQETLYGVPFDLDRLETHGAPVALVEDIDRNSRPSFSRTGTLLYRRTTTGVAPVAWLDSAGKSQRPVSPSIDISRQAETPRLSPDGNRLALAVAGDLFVHDLQRGTAIRLTFDAALNRHPAWTPDGQHIVYGSNVPASNGEFGIWWIRSDGSGQPEKLFGEKTPLQVFTISPDGRTIAFTRTGKDKAFEIWTLPLDLNNPHHPKSGKPEPLARESLSQVDPAFSPDGRWIAYVSTNGAGRGGQITVRPFPSEPSSGRWPVSENGAKFPVWSRNRSELFYLNSDNRIMVVRYTANDHSFVSEKPRPWSPVPLFRPINNALWNLDIAPDGRRFVVLAPPEPKSDEPNTVHATILLNFFDELRRRSGSIR